MGPLQHGLEPGVRREGRWSEGQRPTLPCHHVPLNNSEESKEPKSKAEFSDRYEVIFVKVREWMYFYLTIYKLNYTL